MATQAQVERWEAVFPFIREMSEEDRAFALRSVHFPTPMFQLPQQSG